MLEGFEGVFWIDGFGHDDGRGIRICGVDEIGRKPFAAKAGQIVRDCLIFSSVIDFDEENVEFFETIKDLLI